jgi:hypothetical protein
MYQLQRRMSVFLFSASRQSDDDLVTIAPRCYNRYLLVVAALAALVQMQGQKDFVKKFQ